MKYSKLVENEIRMAEWIKNNPFDIPILEETGDGDYIINDNHTITQKASL